MNASKDYIIEDIEYKKNSVKISFKSFSIEISCDDYLNDYFYKGKRLTEEEIKRYKEEEKILVVKKYIERLLSTRQYFTSQIEDKIKSKFSLDDDKIKKLISIYINNNMLDDKRLTYDLVSSLYYKRYSRELIEDKIRQYHVKIDDDIEEFISQTCKYDDEFFLEYITILDRKYNKFALSVKKNKIVKELLSNGFKISIAKSYVDKYYQNLSEEEKDYNLKYEKDKLDAEISHLMKIINGDDEFKKKNKIISRLLKKGYHYEDIIEALSKRDK